MYWIKKNIGEIRQFHPWHNRMENQLYIQPLNIQQRQYSIAQGAIVNVEPATVESLNWKPQAWNLINFIGIAQLNPNPCCYLKVILQAGLWTDSLCDKFWTDSQQSTD